MKVKRLTETAVLPSKGSSHAAGFDLVADEGGSIPSRRRVTISTGIAVAIPEGFYGRIAPRSGLAAKYGINVLAGVVDSDYRGEVKVILHNTGRTIYDFSQGDRIAQLIIEKCYSPEIEEVEDLDSTVRAAGGFGSTGV